MVDQVVITDVSQKAVAEAGWAQETTLIKLASSGKASAELLKQLAQITANGDKKLLDEIEQASQATIDGIKKAGDRDLNALGGLFAEQGQTTKASLAGLGSLVTISGTFYEKIVKMTKTTEGLYATGLVFQGGMKGLADAASSAGVSVETFSKMLTKYSAVAGTLGVDTLTKVNSMFLEQTHMGADLIMSQEEASDAFLQSVEIMRSSGKLVGMSQADMVKSGLGLVTQFNDLAQATGRNRSEIMKNTTEITKMADFNALMRGMSADDAKKMTETAANLAGQFGDGGKEMASMVAQIKLAGGSMATLPGEMASVVNMVPGLQKAMTEASQGDPEAVTRMRKAIGDMDPQKVRNLMIQFPEAGKTINAWQQQTQQATDIDARRSKMTVEEIENEKRSRAEAARALEVQNKVTAAFARFGNAFDKLALSFGNVLLPAVDAISVVFETLAGWINKITSVMPESGLGQAAILAMVPVVLSVLSSKGITGMLAIGKKLMSAEGLAEIGGKLGSLAKPGKLGELAKSSLGGLGGSAKNMVSGGVSQMGGMLGGIGKAISGLPAIAGDLLKGIAEGIAAFGNPKVLLGAVAIGILAADFWLFTKALQGLNTVDWSSLLKAGIIIGAFTLGIEPFAIAVDAAAVTLAAATPAIMTASLNLAIFGASLIPLAAALYIAAPAFEAFGNIIGKTLGGVADIITSVGTSISGIFDAIGKVDFSQLLGASVAIGGLVAGLSAAAVAAPLIWIGSKVMSNAIAKLGEGIGQAVVAAGPGMEMLINSIKDLTTINGDALIKTATGLRAIGDVFTSSLFDSPVGIMKMENFIEIFKTLGDNNESIEAGTAALRAIGNSGITANTIKGIQLISGMFSTSWFGSLFRAAINPGMITSFTDMFAAFAKARDPVILGIGTLAAIFSIDLKPEKLTGVQKLPDMFSTFSNNKNILKGVTGFTEVFRLLATNEDTIISGVTVLNALTNIDGFVSVFEQFANNQRIISQGVDAINSINRLDLTGLSMLNELNAAIYGGNPGSLSIASTPIVETTSTVIDDATVIYYAKTTQQFDKMIELLTIANKHAERLVNVNEDGHDDVVNAIHSSSGTIY